MPLHTSHQIPLLAVLYITPAPMPTPQWRHRLIQMPVVIKPFYINRLLALLALSS
jgi:hypothetical protein